MRVLMAAPGDAGRVHNLVPLAWALRAAGHLALVAVAPGLVPVVNRAGLVAVSVGRDAGEGRDASAQDPAQDASAADPDHDVRAVFEDDDAAAVADLIDFADQWRPDFVVWDRLVPAGAVVARRLGVPSLRVLDVLDPADLSAPGGGESAARLRAALVPYDAPFDDDLLTGDLTFDPTPPSMRPDPLPDVIPIRYVPYHGPAILPAWLARLPRRPRVLLDAAGAGDRLPVLLGALDALDEEAETICLLPGGGSGSVAEIPDSVRVLESAPLGALIPTCSAVATARPRLAAAALAHGVPLVPDGPDADLAERIVRVAEDAGGRDRAGALRAENDARRGPADVVALLEWFLEHGFEAVEARWPTTTSC